MVEIINGKLNPPIKAVICGPEGIGKTTIAAKAPGALIIDTEGGTSFMDVSRIGKPTSWDELLADIEEVARSPGICQTLVIDTVDWAERLAIQHICEKYRKSGIEEFGYGKGYTYLAEEVGRLLSALDKVIAAGINVIVTAHAKMRKFEQPDEMGAYDRWEMKLTKQVAPLLKEWCDMLLFCNYKTYVVQSDNAMEKAKVQGGKRVMYTSHHPCWDAKNRHGLPDELPLDFASIAHLFVHDQKAEEKPIDKLRAMMAEAQVTEEDIQRLVAEKGHYPADTPISEYTEKFVKGWIIHNWPDVLEAINNQKNNKEVKNYGN